VASKRTTVDTRAKRLRALARNRAERDSQNLVLVESAVVLGVALEARVPIETVVVETDRLGRDDAAVVERARAAGAEVVEVGPGALASLVDTKTPQAVAAVARRPKNGLDMALARATLAVVVVDLGDPGNLGTIVRSAEAAGADMVIVAGASVDPWSPKVVRASAGGVFLLPVVTASTEVALRVAGDAGLRRLAADAAGGRPYDQVDLTVPVAFVIGNEAHGLPAGIDELIDARVHIPVTGRAESLNAAMAASILVFEAAGQRRKSIRSAP
jgi:TrmH family RNA methyltransferase